MQVLTAAVAGAFAVAAAAAAGAASIEPVTAAATDDIALRITVRSIPAVRRGFAAARHCVSRCSVPAV